MMDDTKGRNNKMPLRIQFRRLAALVTSALALSAAISAQGAATTACKNVVLTGDPDYPPFSWYENKTFHGSAIEIAALALEHIHIPYSVRYVGAFPQVLNEARTGKIDLVAELKSTPDRRVYLAYSTIPIFTNPVAVFTRSEQKFSYQNWDNLIGHPGVMVIDNRFGGGFDEFLSNRLTVESVDNIGASFDKLASGQADYFVNSYYPAISYLIKKRQDADFKALQPFVTATENFSAWSRASPCAAKIAEFDAALVAMVHAGEIKKILDFHSDRLRHGVSLQTRD